MSHLLLMQVDRLNKIEYCMFISSMISLLLYVLSTGCLRIWYFFHVCVVVSSPAIISMGTRQLGAVLLRYFITFTKRRVIICFSSSWCHWKAMVFACGSSCTSPSLCFIRTSFLELILESAHVKTSKMTVRPAKTQISLGMHPVWSESSLCAQWVAKDRSFLLADSDMSRRLWSDWADLSPRWAHMPFCWFCLRWLINKRQTFLLYTCNI